MKLLFVIDMQNDFIDGSLGSEMAVEAKNNLIKKLNDYDEKEYLVFVTKDLHIDEYYLDTQEGKLLPVKHCMLGTKGFEINDDIKKSLERFRKKVLFKSSFGFTEWYFYIQNLISRVLNISIYESINHIESIEIVGLCTDICVVSNTLILKSLFKEVPISVDASCCAGVTLEKHKAALEVMKSCQINVINERE